MATEQEKKSWEQMSNAEKKESFDKYMKYKLFEAHKTAKADWQRDMSKEEVDNTMPYNALTGKTYSRETSMLLRAEMAIKGYDKAQFVTMEQGNAMGGVLKLKHDEQTGEILKTKNGLQARVDGVKMLYIADHELRPKLDKDGKEVIAAVKDKDGNVRLDENTGKAITYVVKEKIPIKPRLSRKPIRWAKRRKNQGAGSNCHPKLPRGGQEPSIRSQNRLQQDIGNRRKFSKAARQPNYGSNQRRRLL